MALSILDNLLLYNIIPLFCPVFEEYLIVFSQLYYRVLAISGHYTYLDELYEDSGLTTRLEQTKMIHCGSVAQW